MATFIESKRFKDGIIRQTSRGGFVGEIHQGGARRRSKTFSERAAAEKWINNCIKAREEHGRNVIAGREADDARSAQEVLKKAHLQVTLTAAAEFYAKHHRQTEEAWTVSETLARYLNDMKHPQDGSSPARERSVINKQRRLRTFVEAYGDRKVPEITVGDVTAWLKSTGAEGRNLRNYKGEVQTLFNFAANQEAEDKMPGQYVNTVAVFKTARRKEVRPAEIVEPRHVKAVLHWLEGVDAEVAVGHAVACFAGLRTSELVHGGGLQWSDIDFEENVIRVPASLSKTRDRRDVKILPNLLEWLIRHRQESGRVTTLEGVYTRRRREACAATGAHWPDNGARHSFGTYYAKLHGYREAADMLGHVGGIRMLMDHYSGKCTKAGATEYFSITPAVTGQVIKMTQAQA